MDNRDAPGTGEHPIPGTHWQLRLYISGKTSLRTILALQNLTEICQKHLPGRYELEVIDLLEDFSRAEEDKVLALPTLVRRSPQPVRKIIGDLSNAAQVIMALGLPGAEKGAI